MNSKTPNITTNPETITPDEAGQLLTIHYERMAKGEFQQRNIAKSVVARYAADMIAGNWILSPQPITIDEDGNILDGQHRLEACRQSGVTITFMISRGWPNNFNNGNLDIATIDIIDRGRPRSVGQQLQLHGVTGGNNWASCINCIVRFSSGREHAKTASYAAICTIMKKFGMDEHIEFIRCHGGHRNFVGRIVGPLAFYHTTRPKKAEEFAHRLFHLEMDKDTGPHAFARFMQNNPQNHQDKAIQAIASGIRAWDANETITHIKPSIEATRWLTSTNTKLADQIRKIVTGKS